MSSQQLQEFTNALLSIQKGASGAPLHPKAEVTLDGVHAKGKFGESHLMLPKFRVGSLTTAGLIVSDTRLGALAALSNYMNENEQQAGEWNSWWKFLFYLFYVCFFEQAPQPVCTRRKGITNAPMPRKIKSLAFFVLKHLKDHFFF